MAEHAYTLPDGPKMLRETLCVAQARELTVVRITEGQMTISYGNEAIAIRGELVPILAEMVAEAAAWKDDPNE